MFRTILRRFAGISVWCVTAATLVGVSGVARHAGAEELLTHISLGVASGLEGTDIMGTQAWRRARTRVFGGLDLRWDEGKAQGFSFRAFAEVERHASLGGEVRWTAWPSKNVGLFGGGAFVIAPRSLWGAVVGAELILPLSQSVGILFEPSLQAFPLGSDLPEKAVLMWGSMALGVRVGL